MELGILAQINQSKLNRMAIATVTDITTGKSRLVSPDEAPDDPMAGEISARFASGKSGLVQTDSGEMFVQVYVPAPRIVVIGAVHISQAFYPMAQACGFDVTIIDPRSAFATEERFSSVTLHAEWPQDIMKEISLDAYTAVVALTHDPKIDDFPLQAGLKAECFYVGALGSRKTHAKRCHRLLGEGVPQSQLDRIHAPIGLNIGASTPTEIAVAILAEIIESLRHRREHQTKEFAA